MKKDKKSKKKDSKKIKEKKVKLTIKNDDTPIKTSELEQYFKMLYKLYQFHVEQPIEFNNQKLFPSEYNTLLIIDENQNSNLTQLATYLEISKSATTKNTNKLLEKTLITKTKSSKIARTVLFNLTPEGQAISDALKLKNTETKKAVEKILKKIPDKTCVSETLENLCQLFNQS